MLDTNEFFLIYYLVIGSLYFFTLILVDFRGGDKLSIAIISTITISVLYALRADNIASDSKNYLVFVSESDVLVQGMSPFIIYIGRVVNMMSGGSFVFFLIVSLIVNLGYLYSFYKVDKEKYLIIMAFFSVSFLFLNSNINMLRQGMAISIGTIAIYNAVSSNYLKYFVFSLISLFIHSSAVILFLVPVLLLIKEKQVAWLVFFILAFLFFLDFSIQPFLSELKGFHWSFQRLHWYFTWDNAVRFELKHVYYLYLILIVYCLISFDSLDPLLKRFSLVLLSIPIVVVVFRPGDFMVDRFSLYFVPIILITFVKLTTQSKVFNNGLIYKAFLCLPALWLFKSAYQFNSWWILGNIR